MPSSAGTAVGQVNAEVKATGGRKAKASLQPRGRPGYFQGARKEYLESNLPAYMASKRKNRQAFWHGLLSGWWERFPWKLDDGVEPPKDDLTRMAELAAVAPGEEPQKAQVERALRQRLKTWFVNHASATNTPNREVSAWIPLLRRLHQLKNPRPRCRTAVQQYMLDHADLVDANCPSHHPDGRKLSNSERMNQRYEVAKSQLGSQDPSLTEKLEEKAAAEHELAMKEWDLILGGVSQAADVTQARDSLFDAIHPLLKAVGTYAGCYVSLIAGKPKSDDDEGFFTAVHWWPGDRSPTVDWTQWDSCGSLFSE